MNDVFISYANADRATAQQMADALEALGCSVWWDREIPFGKPFDQVIEEELNAAKCVVVLWSRDSVKSRWVKTEAGAAADRDRLVPVLIEDVPIPLEFRRIQTAMLQGWNGDRAHPELLQLVDSIRQMIGQPQAPRTEAPHSARVPVGTSWRPRLMLGAGVLLLALIALIVVVGRRSEQAPGRTALPRSNGPVSGSLPADSSSPPPSVPAAPAAATAAGAPATSTASVKGAFNIRIGDRIDDGVPSPGAGNIESPGVQNVYTFTAKAGQRVYFRLFEYGKGMEQIGWRVTGPDEEEIFDTRLGYSEPGAYTLKKGGVYKMTVGSASAPATGTYRMQLFNVPPPQQFSIKVGDMIQDDMPGPGAGYIESPGAKDIYTFTAAAGQRVYFRKFEHGPGLEQINWTLTDSDTNEIFDSRLGYSEPGVVRLRKAGTYTLTVGADRNPKTGSYRLRLFDVPPIQQFAVKIGDTIGENVPAKGAGLIESPGAADVYTFTASAGQRVYFRKLAYGTGMEQIGWKLTDSDGTVVFDSRLAYSEPGAQVLHKGGTYTMIVGSDTVPATGSYRLQLSSAQGG